MIAWIYANRVDISIISGILMGTLFFGLSQGRASQSDASKVPGKRFSPPSRGMVVLGAVLLILLIAVGAGGVVDHQPTLNILELILGILFAMTLYWFLIALYFRLFRRRTRQS